jgi:suppressor of fused protein SUFU
MRSPFGHGTNDPIHDGIRRHYETVWDADRIDEVHWTPGPVATRLPQLHIVKVKPRDQESFWTFATIGAWQATAKEPAGLEFIATAQGESAAVMLHLVQTAFYHAGSPEQRLGAGHTVPLGEGWTEGSPLDHVLISLPYLWGPRLEHCALGDRHIQVLWVLPIHSSELQYKVKHGLEALERLFEERSIDYLDPFRPAVV